MSDSQNYYNNIDLEKMLTLSEEIQAENEELKEQTSSLLSQISILKEELQNSTDREVKLNEKIATMSESDKIEQENERLKEKNESLKREKKQAEQEAETRVRNFKAQYEAKYRELNEQKERLANREKKLKEEESKINESVSNKVGYIYDQLEKKYQFKHNSLYTFFVGTTLYSFLITIFQGFKSKYFISDLKYALTIFKSWIVFIYDFLLKQKPLDSNVGQWVVFIGIVIVTIGVLIAVIGSLGWFAHKLYTEYTDNWLNVAIALITLSGAVFFADELHSCDFNWVFGFLVIQILYLFLILLNASDYNK